MSFPLGVFTRLAARTLMHLVVRTFLRPGGRTLLQFLALLPVGYALPANAQTALNVEDPYREPFRPQVHFSPREKWMNDPNGLVFDHGVYHLFFQYYPHGTTWGPMHWGHATSIDLMHWRQQPVALYPDSLGYIFSGSAVVDSNNTGGFGQDGKIPLVAIFTHHDPKGEKNGTANFQNESIAYSLDQGKTWVKYRNNPVLQNPGIKDFRDPKVMWYAPGHKWVMSLATGDRISFYSSHDLKNWSKESEFGSDKGAHGGVWECPDLFPLTLDGKTWWVLFVSINPGGPNGGSGTQYFIGQFDGSRFTPADEQIKWIDYGPDDYAGVTWNNTGNRRIFLGWMSNWDYANAVPTRSWRNAMTLPRELSLRKENNSIFLCSRPVKEVNALKVRTPSASLRTPSPSLPDSGANQYVVAFRANATKDFSIVLSNAAGETLTVGFDKASDRYYIDRRHAGMSAFHRDFAATSFAPRLTRDAKATLTLVVDAASVELFADGGLTVMTAIFFPAKPLGRIGLHSGLPDGIRQISWSELKSIW